MAEPADAAPRPGFLSPLAVRDFRILFLGFSFVHLAHPIQAVSQIFWLQEMAPEDSRFILVGVVGLVRGAGMVSLGLIGGALADRHDRRRLLMALQASALLVNVAVGLTMLVVSPSDPLALALVFGLTFFGSGQASVDLPTRQASAPDILGPRLTPGGLGLMLAGMLLVFPLAIFSAGLLTDAFGAPTTYALTGACHFVGLATLFALRYRSRPGAEDHGLPLIRETLRNVRIGLRYTRDHDTLFAIVLTFMVSTTIVTAAAGHLGPTWVTTVVGASFSEFSLMQLAWVGAAGLVGLSLTRYALFERKGALFVTGLLLFTVGFLVFSSGHVWPFVVVGNLLLGAGLATTSVAATHLVAHFTSPAVRARVMGLLLLSLGTVQMLTLAVAGAAQAFGFETVFPVLAVTNALLVLAALLAWSHIRHVRIPRSDAALGAGALAGGKSGD